jgi:uncharacterized zinc-type alcohol dehydrogenase-like protein
LSGVPQGTWRPGYGPLSSLIFRNRTVAGSIIGGIPEREEMLDFGVESGIVADIELIAGDRINQAWGALLNGDVAHRYVIDMGSVRAP